MKFFNPLMLVLFFVVMSEKSYTNAQTISQEVIGSSGTFVESTEGSMAWTIGEVTIITYSSAENFLTQGFHQPSEKGSIEVITDFFIPEGFSPNSDAINDFFVIRGISKYPKNSIKIYNRWGNLVYEASPYQNLWDGKTKMGVSVGEDQLPVGTYFYVFDFGNDTKIIKGTIYLNK